MICLLVAGFLVLNLLSIAPLIVVATLLAYLLLPLVLFYEQRVLAATPLIQSRTLAVLLTFVTVIALFVLLGFVMFPVFFNQLEQIADGFPRFLADLEAELTRVLSQPLTFNGDPIMIDGREFVPMEQLQTIFGENQIEGLIQSENVDVLGTVSAFVGSVGGLTGSAFTVLGSFFNTAVNITFLVLIMFYLMRDGEKFTAHLVNITPPAYQGDVRRLLYELGRVWNAYLRGQLILCISVGFAVFVAASVLGLPNAPILGLLAGLLEFIPNLGPFLALIPAFTLALFNQSTTLPFLEGLPFAILVAVTWTGIQNLESFFLVPRVMGGSLNLHPVVVIIGVIAGASVAGALGLVLAAPFLATARLFSQYIYGKLFDIDPFLVPVTGAEHGRPIEFSAYLRGQARRSRVILWRAHRRLPGSIRQRIPRVTRITGPRLATHSASRSSNTANTSQYAVKQETEKES